MISQHWTIAPPPACFAVAEAKAHARADSLMIWGHAVALGGSLAGIAGGFGLVAYGTLSSVIVALLFAAPVASMVLSSLLYTAAWHSDSVTDKHDAANVHAWSTEAAR